MDKLTRKQQGFVKDYIATDNAVQSALKNYDTDDYNTAAVIGHENLNKPNIQKAIADMIPDELLKEKHLALLNKIDKEGEIDVQAVKAGLDMGYKIKGTYAPEKKDVTFEGIVNTRDPKNVALAERFEKELKDNI